MFRRRKAIGPLDQTCDHCDLVDRHSLKSLAAIAMGGLAYPIDRDESRLPEIDFIQIAF